MSNLILAVLLHISAFTLDYWHFLKKGNSYKYVSRETYAIFWTFGTLALLLFHVELWNFFQHAWQEELLYVIFGYSALFLCCWGLMRSGGAICVTMRRTEHCINYHYVFVKSKEIFLQQLLFLVLAMEIYRLVDSGFWSVITFITVISLIQIPQLLHVERFWKVTFTLLTPLLGTIYYNSYMEIGHFWPALYLNVLVYMFIWVVFSESYPFPAKNSGDNQGDKGIKDNVQY
tara:strand:- start:721 stop:1413 length:693 start_codon:yes stop_codon:yes gene_type:complete